MVEYSDDQKQLAKVLLKGPMSVEDLREESKIPMNRINEALKELIKLKLVDRDGSKYKLIDYVTKGVEVKPRKPREVEENYRVRLIIEALSKDKGALQAQLDILEGKLKEEPVSLLKLDKAETELQGENYTSYLDVEAGVRDFKDLLYLIINYGPSSVELLEPQKIELSMGETQEALNEVSSAVHYYVSFILGLQQKLIELKSELETKDEGSEAK